MWAPRERPRGSDRKVTPSPAMPSVLPEIAEPIGSEFSISYRVLDVLVAEVMLQRPGIHSLVGQLESGCMPQHVRMHAERHPGDLPSRVSIRRKALIGPARPQALWKNGRSRRGANSAIVSSRMASATPTCPGRSGYTGSCFPSSPTERWSPRGKAACGIGPPSYLPKCFLIRRSSEWCRHA
jgi:hypothetical protein